MRIALGLSYAGQGYHGWQSQLGVPTVQDALESALGQFAGNAISTLCAGRTDAGVHGLMQVVHFDAAVDRAPFSWVRGVNRYLPPDIAVQWAQIVPDTFHARASAVARRYAYLVLESTARPSLDAPLVGWSFRPLEPESMQKAAAHLLGTHDFTSFRAAQCQAHSPVRTLLQCDVRRFGHYWRFDFEADAFLHHMIRNIMGSLLAVGQGLQHPDWIKTILLARNRSVASATFAPNGLYFLGPRYDSQWGLPDRTAAFDLLPGA